MDIVEAIEDENLFRPFLGDDLSSWRSWMAALRVIYGIPIPKKRHALIQECTGRDCDLLPKNGFDTALFLTGRRSGKSRMAAVIGAFEAILAGHESRLSKGERGICAIISPTKAQSRIVKNYLRAIFEAPLLAAEVVQEDREGFDLRNGKLRVEIIAGDHRSSRGRSVVCAVIDEACFFGYDQESKVKSDTELITAIKPSLATTGGKLICISTPYARKGWCFNQWKRCYGNDKAKTLIWQCPSRTMNPTLPQSVIDDAIAQDLSGARSEFYAEWRSAIGAYIPREVVEALVVKDRLELMPAPGIKYTAFADLSGGRVDDAALAIAHKDKRKVVVDVLCRYRSPHDPQSVIRQMASVLREFGLNRCTGDKYGAEFVTRAFQAVGIKYANSEQNKAELYLELLPRLCSGEIELLDDEVLVDQLASLERRTRSGGRDLVDHPPGGHDDLANVIAGVCCAKIPIKVGAMW